MIRQFHDVTDSHYRLIIRFCYCKLHAILVICFNRKPSFFIAMKSFEMKRLKWEQVFFALSLNQELDSFLVSSNYLWLKP